MEHIATQEFEMNILEDPKVTELSIVLVGWNNKDYLEPCLDSLFQAELKSQFDVIVVDNGSTDGSQEMLADRFPQVRLIQNNHNVGLARACNQGIIATQGRYILLLNNDTLVDGKSLDGLVELLDNTSDAGAAGGRLLNPDGTFQAGFADFSSLGEEFLIATRIGERLQDGYPSHQDSDQVITVGWLSSACLLLRRAALDQVGLLDEEYFIYGDEADLQYRLQQAGWLVYYSPAANTIHYGGRSMDRWRRRKMVNRGKLLFYRKNYGVLRTTALRLMIGALSLIKLAIWAILFVIPNRREESRQELSSNLDVVKVCMRLG